MHCVIVCFKFSIQNCSYIFSFTFSYYNYNKAVDDLLSFVAILINIIQRCGKLEVDTRDQPGPSGIQVTSTVATQASTSQAGPSGIQVTSTVATQASISQTFSTHIFIRKQIGMDCITISSLTK